MIYSKQIIALHKPNLISATNVDESLRNGSSSIIGIGPGKSLHQGDYCSTNNYCGSLNRPQNNINQTPNVITSFNQPGTNTLPLNRINNAHQKNGIHQKEPLACLGPGENVQNNAMNSSLNHSLSQTPTPPPMPPIQHLATSKANFSGMGTHV